MHVARVLALFFLPILAAALPGGPPPPKTTSTAKTTTVKTTVVPTTTTKKITTTVVVTATPTATNVSQCNTGPIQCCNSVQSSSSSAVAGLLGLLGVVLQGINVPIGLTCSPLSVIGIGGNSCTAAPVCCENNSFNGLIAIGCSPIIL